MIGDGHIFGSRFADSAAHILHNLALERTGWRRYVFGRWYIPSEPLRNDAARLLREYGYHEMHPLNTQLVGEDKRDD